jgi:hypothetical protein
MSGQETAGVDDLRGELLPVQRAETVALSTRSSAA